MTWRAKEAVLLTSVLISTLPYEGLRPCRGKPCWHLAAYFHELMANRGGVNASYEHGAAARYLVMGQARMYRTCNEINYRVTWDPRYRYNNTPGGPVSCLLHVADSANPFPSRIFNVFQIAKHLLAFKQLVQLRALTCTVIPVPPVGIFSLFSHPAELL